MLITKITRTKGGLLAVMSGGEQIALLDDKAIEEHDIGVGVDVPDDVLEDIQRESDERRALTAGLYLVAKREYCRKQIVEKLRRSHDEEAAEYAADELCRLGFVDDRRYAEKYALICFEDKHFFTRRVVYELTAKGIDRSLAQEVCAELEPDEDEAIDALLDGRLGMGLDSEAGIRRTTATLERYGYSRAKSISHILKRCRGDEI